MANAIEIKDLQKIYKGGMHALKGVSFEVAEGDFFALLGPNGAGKSTTIGVLTTLVNITSGSASVFGYDVAKDPTRAKMQIGVVPQEFDFSPFSLVEDVVMDQAAYYGVPRSEAKRRAKDLLERLGLWQKRRDLSKALSGGMKRRLMIARALVHNPRLLILDEPTAGVDIELRRSMWDFLVDLNEAGTTILLTTHYLEEAEQLCRNIAIVNHGEVVSNTSMKELLSQLEEEYFILYPKGKCFEKPDLPEYKLRCDGKGALEVSISKGQSLTDLIQKLAESGLEIESMRNKSNRLEELFLSLTQEESADAA